MWIKAIELILQWLKTRPRSDLVVQVVALRDAMAECHDAWQRYDGVAEGDPDRLARYGDWRRAFGGLENAMHDIDYVLHIFGKDAHREVRRYMVSEAEPSPQDGETVAAAAFVTTGSVPDNPQSTTAKVDFPEALAELDRFISATFKPEEVLAARRSVI